MSMTLAQRLTENRRACILRTLSEAPGYGANESLLQVMVEEFGFACSRDNVRSEIAWLAEQGLVSYHVVADVMVARITQRGLDVAEGRATVPGVKPRGPQD